MTGVLLTYRVMDTVSGFRMIVSETGKPQCHLVKTDMRVKEREYMRRA